MKSFYKTAYVLSFVAEFFCLVVILGWLGALLLGVLIRLGMYYIHPYYISKLMKVKYSNNKLVNDIIIHCLIIMSPVSSALELIWQ